MSEQTLTEQAARSPGNIKSEFGPMGRWFGQRYFDRVRLAGDTETALADLSSRGFVVHVMRTSATINYLFLDWVLSRRSLAPVRAVVNLRGWFFRPWKHAAMHRPVDVRLTYARRQQGSALVFLKTPAFARRQAQAAQDPFPELVEFARKSERPVFLVPGLFVWEKNFQRLNPSAFDYIWGSPEAPGLLHSFFAFLRNVDRAQYRIGQPIELTRFIAENADSAPASIARKVRGALHHHLSRETRAVFGPPAKPTGRLIEETLRDRTLGAALDEVVQSTGRSPASVRREVEKHLNVIAADIRPFVVGLAGRGVRLLLNRIYDSVEVDEAGLDRAMKSATAAPLVLVVSHKSHIDYLLLSALLWERGYRVPMVAAGANLSFFPLGTFLRRCGAFFLRRSFKGDKVYAAAFRAYIKKLVHDGVPVEFFPEGGRSRTGKLLSPKLGMFSWQTDAVLEGAAADLSYAPVAIDYEQIVETVSYSKELQGGAKKAEDVGALLGSSRVLTENYGRIYINFGETFSFSQVMKERGLTLAGPISDEQKRGLVRALGNQAMFRIAQVTTITPHALLAAALLGHRRRGLAAAEISDRIHFLRKILEDVGTRQSRHLINAPASPEVLGPISDALAMFAASGWVETRSSGDTFVVQVRDHHRMELSLPKNSLLNHIAGRTIVACALLKASGRAPMARVRTIALALSRLFKFEFIYPVGVPFNAIFDETVEHFVKLGIVIREGDELLLGPDAATLGRVQFLAALIQEYFEAYGLVARALARKPHGSPVPSPEFLKEVMELGRAEHLTGAIACSEALSKPTFENALSLMRERGAVSADEHQFVDAARSKSLAEEISAFLENPVVSAP